tara:strand:+ start:525 stop:809 length:285 start_codon:yes stop_codon:yes gene_type:complete
MRIRLTSQQAEILSDAVQLYNPKLLTEDQTIALGQVRTLLKNEIKSEIDSNDLKFESIIGDLVDQGKYIGVSDDLNKIHQNIKEQNSLRKNKYK